MDNKPQVKLSNIIPMGYLIFVSILALTYSFVCTPLNLVVTSNILMMETVIPLMLDLIMTVMNFLFYWVSFAYLIRGIFRYGIGGSKLFFVAYGALSFIRYLLSMLASFVVLGFPGATEFFALYFVDLIFYIFMDGVQIAIAAGISHGLKSKRGGWELHMPAESLWNLQNPILLSALFACCVPAVISLLARLFYDINYGFPTSGSELLLMILYYLSDVVSVLVGYFVVLYLLNRFSIKEESI